MLCTIYHATFELNHNKKIQRALKSMYSGENGEYDYYYNKPSHVKPLMKSKNFHFTSWEPIIKKFDPNIYGHWNYLLRVVGKGCGYISLKDIDFLNEVAYDWMPSNTYRDTRYYLDLTFKNSFDVYKVVDERGHIVDTTPFIEKYYEIMNEKFDKSANKFNEYIYTHKLSWSLRHPHTTNEMKQDYCKEDLEYFRENGYKLHTRAKRKNLPDTYDDIWVTIPRCWKDRTKQAKQYNAKRTARRKKLRGAYQ